MSWEVRPKGTRVHSSLTGRVGWQPSAGVI